MHFLEEKDGVTAVCENGALERIAQACGGDLRKAANAVELLFSAGRQPDGTVHLSLADATQLTRDVAGFAGFDIGNRGVDGHTGRIGLRRGGEQDDCVGQRQTGFGKP